MVRLAVALLLPVALLGSACGTQEAPPTADSAPPATRKVAPMDPRDVMTRPARMPDAVFRYGSHAEQIIDVHLPPRPLDSVDRAAVVVLVHGGFWQPEYDRLHTRPLAEALSAAGYVVLTPEYRRTGYPQTLDDVAAAVSAVPEIESVAPGRADLEAVALMGHSSGGHLAMWAALRPDAPRVRTVVALAPVGDLVRGHELGLGNGAVADLMGGPPDEAPQAYAAADPAQLLTRPGVDVQITVVHGTDDVHVPIELSRGLTGVDLVELEDVEHFGLIDPLSPAWPAVHDALR